MKTLLVITFITIAIPVWAGNLSLKASRVTQTAHENGLTYTNIIIFERHVISGSPLKTGAYCYNGGNGSYELKLAMSHPQFKEIFASALSSALVSQPVNITTENETCFIRGFGVVDQ